MYWDMQRRNISFDLHSPDRQAVSVFDQDLQADSEITFSESDAVEQDALAPSTLRVSVLGISSAPVKSSELIRENNEEVDRSAAARTGRQRLKSSDILYNNDSNCNAPAPVNLDSITPSAFEEEDGISFPFQLGQCQSILRNIPASDS